MKRGLTYAEAMAYVGVKRRTFDAAWRPRLRALHQGTCLIFDRQEIDALFDALKEPSADGEGSTTTLAATLADAQNETRNERPNPLKGVRKWADKNGVSTPITTEPGKSTSSGGARGFANAASRVLAKRKAG